LLEEFMYGNQRLIRMYKIYGQYRSDLNRHKILSKIQVKYSLDEKVQFEDYLELLKIMVLIIIKINEEFCGRE